MLVDLVSRVRALGVEAQGLPEKRRVYDVVSRQSGMRWSLTKPGLIELVKTFASGSQNPSKIYRVHARNSPNKPALIWRGRTTTWAELDERVDRFSSGLTRRGLGRKQSVMLM